MRTNLEFTSTEFPPDPSEEDIINPGRFGKRLTEFLQENLPKYGFKVIAINAEDWGYRLEIKNEAFPLWIGCGNYEEFENGFLCFIEPSKPFIRKLFKKVSTTDIIEELGIALEACLRESGKAEKLRWWSEDGK